MIDITCKGFIGLLLINLNIHRPPSSTQTERKWVHWCEDWWVGCEKVMSISIFTNTDKTDEYPTERERGREEMSTLMWRMVRPRELWAVWELGKSNEKNARIGGSWWGLSGRMVLTFHCLPTWLTFYSCKLTCICAVFIPSWAPISFPFHLVICKVAIYGTFFFFPFYFYFLNFVFLHLRAFTSLHFSY